MVNSSLNSMTGFAAQQGQSAPYSWSWDIRSVNARGLDIRLRVPDWIEGLEQGLRRRLSKALGRGNVSLVLRIQREENQSELQINPDQLLRVVQALSRVEQAASEAGLVLSPTSAADILAQRGVLEAAEHSDDSKALAKQLTTDFETLLDGFLQMRAAEGQALTDVMQHQVAAIESLTAEAAKAAAARKPHMAASLKENLTRILDNSDGADAARVAQELALIAVKTDVTEEIDRLGAHVLAARDLLRSQVPVGRKLDFLMQEFNREANTLCAKSQSAELTRIGLDLKATIDQMREQVQNVE